MYIFMYVTLLPLYWFHNWTLS